MWSDHRALYRISSDSLLSYSVAHLKVVLAALTLLTAECGPALAQHATLSDAIQQLTGKETEDLAKRLGEQMAPGLVGDDFRGLVRNTLKKSKPAQAGVDSLDTQSPDIELTEAEKKELQKRSDEELRVGRAIATTTAKKLAEQIEERFPDPESPVRKLLTDIENDEGGKKHYRAFAKALLDADLSKAGEVAYEKLNEEFTSWVEKLKDEGIELSKGLINDIAPGGQLAKRFGTTPVDAGMAAANEFAEEVERWGDRKIRFDVDCFYRTYQHEKAAGPEEAQWLVFSSDYDCVSAQEAEGHQPDTASDSMSDARRGLGRFANRLGQRGKQWSGTLDTLGISKDELVALADKYDEAVARGDVARSQSPSEAFQEFLRTQIRNKRARARAAKSKRTASQSEDDRIISESLSDWAAAHPPPKGLAERAYDRAMLASYPIREAYKNEWAHSRPVLEIQDFVQLVSGFATTILEAMRATMFEDRFKEVTRIPDDGLPSEDFLPEVISESYTARMAAERDKSLNEEQRNRKAQEGKFAKKDDESEPKAEKSKEAESCERDPDAPDAMKDERGCMAFGAPTRELSYVYISPEDVAELEANAGPEASDHCDELGARIVVASTHYGDGEIDQAKDILSDVSQSLAKLSEPDACPDIRERVKSNFDKVERIGRVLAAIDEALTQCEPTRIERQVSLLESATNRKLVAMRNRLEKSESVAVYYTSGKEAYLDGDIEFSKTMFQDALKDAEEADTCNNIKSRIGRNLQRISRLQDFDRATASAVDSCDLQRITSLIKGLEGTTNPYLDNAYERLTNVPERCQRKRANAACETSFGSNALASETTRNADGGYTCECRSGYQWKSADGGSGANSCVSIASVNEQNRRARNANCRKQYGSGYFSGPTDKKGNYYCLPTKSVANSWCNRNNKGTGWYAGKINSKGGYNCYTRNKRTAKRKARTRQRVYRKRKGRTRYRRPNYDAQAAAAAAAAAGAILQGIQAHNRSKRRRRGHRGRRGGGCAANPMGPNC